MIYRIIPVVAAFVIYLPIVKFLYWASDVDLKRDKFEITCLHMLAAGYTLLLVSGTYMTVVWVITGDL